MRTGLAALLFAGLTAASPARAGDAGCAPHVEEDHRWRSARLRAHTDALRECPVTEDVYRETVAGWLERRPVGAAPIESFFLGRAIEYPWLSRALAAAAIETPGWDAAKGRARRGHVNALVGELLSAPAILARLQAPFDGAGLRTARISVEKVLVDRADTALPGHPPDDRLTPFDAQVWLHLERIE